MPTILRSGQHLQRGRYRIEKPLGEGGMGRVYLATDRNLPGRRVAIKVNATTSAAAQKQFLREAILLARLDHPNLPRVSDHFVEPSGYQYLVMDYIDGQDLRHVLQSRRGPLPEADVLKWIDQILDALIYMHHGIDDGTGRSAPILHRDIKPSNIKLMPSGHIMLVDFGLAKVQTDASTTRGARAFTPGYAPIEQYTGGTDMRADVYAVGATLYALLTGQMPPEATTLAAGAPLTPPSRINPAISRNTEAVILRAMQVRAADRYPAITAMRDALRSAPRFDWRSAMGSWIPRWRPKPLPGSLWMWGLLLCAALFGIVAASSRAVPASEATPSVAPTAATVTAPAEAPSASADEPPAAGAITTNPVDDARYVYIPAGEFQMGIDADDGSVRLVGTDASAAPAHTVMLDGFWMAQTEVTNAQYAGCVAAGVCTEPNNTRWQDAAYADHPVTDVDWAQASAYATWVNGRLPTEAEWEKAARGTDAHVYPWGEEPPGAERLNFRFAVGDTTPVGSYPDGASPYGLLDMAGNVEEWVADWYDATYYAESPRHNPMGPENGILHVVRGGSYSSQPPQVRTTYRGKVLPAGSFETLGFRVVVDEF